MIYSLNLSKIINDPVHGFIEVPKDTILGLIDTPVFQRLRRIKQLGLSSLVYPGATHTRFSHALGALHLMRQALDVLRRKSVGISEKEYEAALIAILLHDIGHGPFSHALESAIIPGLHHEDMSVALMNYLNQELNGRLDLAIRIFEGTYPRTFLHQLVSSQLDMDRMDYLIRDSFFTGVAEGVVGIDRIIKILNVYDEKLVCESKGIYSVEKFIVARRLMYWQVYLHKAALSAEYLIVNALKRAKELYKAGEYIFTGEPLEYFFSVDIHPQDLNGEVIVKYIQLDDNNIEYAIKQWQHHRDPILSDLCKRLLGRNLLKVELRNIPFNESEIQQYRDEAIKTCHYSEDEISYFVQTGKISNQAYLKGSKEPIMIWFKSGDLKDLVEVSDVQNIAALSEPVVKYFLCYPRQTNAPEAKVLQ